MIGVNMIIAQEDITQDMSSVGKKTLHLKKLKDYGFLVPDFVAISSETIEKLVGNEIILQDVCKEIRGTFHKNLYAVRSSALIEDQSESSMAGQFHTEIKISPLSLEGAIKKVLEQSKGILGGGMNNFSIIIQEYIEAEYSGVTFTRNPNGKREMVVEYHRGVGEDLVSGKITPTSRSFYWQENINICGFETNIFKEIEGRFSFPQDIEWCIKDGKLFILQTRPITTISADSYKAILFLETELSKKKDFYFEKTEISEVAPRPTPFTLSLLERIYGDGGPIMNVYKKHSISYTSNRFLKIIGNELFIDRDLEAKTLLPALGFSGKNYTLKLETFRGFFRTIKNIFSTSTMREDGGIIKRLKGALIREDIKGDFCSSLDRFLTDYETIFEVNIFAAKYLKKLEILLKNEKILIVDLLGTDPHFFNPTGGEVFHFHCDVDLMGNTLEISDEAPFYFIYGEKKIPSDVQNWWEHLPEWKKSLYKKPLFQTIAYQQYREYARILMVKNLNTLRKSLWATPQPLFSDQRNIYFHSEEEIKNNTLNEKLCIKRKTEYITNNIFHLDSKLTHYFIEDTASTFGVSPGLAVGYITTEEAINNGKTPKILYTNMLSPTLTKHFSQIVGIVSENGGFLSHLAIIAREQKLPIVVIGGKKDIMIGDYIEINGSNGEIKKGIS